MSVSGWSGPSFDSSQLERRLVHLDGLVGAAGVEVGRGEVVAAGERVGVVGAELRLSLLERRLVHLDGVVGAAGVRVGHGEVVAAGERVGVVGAEPRLAQLQRARAAGSPAGRHPGSSTSPPACRGPPPRRSAGP